MFKFLLHAGNTCKLSAVGKKLRRPKMQLSVLPGMGFLCRFPSPSLDVSDLRWKLYVILSFPLR